jgi:CDP-paratose 2-epimerase
MRVVIVTGSGGLIGAETVRFFAKEADLVVGIDNDMRAVYFGSRASTSWAVKDLRSEFTNYVHRSTDIRDASGIERLFREYSSDVSLVVHTAAQPSHDWAAGNPAVDFAVNANGTLNLLEAVRKHAPQASFIFTSTNKVYGDRPNTLPLVELDTRWELEESHPYYAHGVDENMSLDHSTHSLFGVSKLSADVMVQEYGRYFGLNTVVFRGGCLTGPGHSGTRLHGFLSYLLKCTALQTPYTVRGYKGKQVRDNIHSLDLVRAFEAYYRDPTKGKAYNIGGGRFSNCSMLEAISICQDIADKTLVWSYDEEHRRGDHIWWISDTRRFQKDYPHWSPQHNIKSILVDIFERSEERWVA